MRIINALFIVSIMLIAGCSTERVIGGQKDQQGCLTGAGYSWDSNVAACTRSWEIKGELATAAKIAVAPMSVRPITIVSVTPTGCNGCYDVQIKVGDVTNTLRLVNWKVVSSRCGECPQLMPAAPGWCSDGIEAAGKINECGCPGPPTCERACTEEAKICPDGSAVGRDSANNCEFAPCPAQLANPASVYCKDQGGREKMVENENGTQGICVLADGTECDEWQYFRGECPTVHTCTERQKACTMEYLPVCGWFDGTIKCVKYPCAATYGNGCAACADPKVKSWTAGECP